MSRHVMFFLLTLDSEHAAKLIAAGHTLTVESSLTRCVDDQQYKEVGCTIVPAGSWKTLAPANTLILGLKELDEESQGPAHYPITHRHIYFAHCYKNQGGWKELLQRFVLGNGTLYDMEFLTFVSDTRTYSPACMRKIRGLISLFLNLTVIFVVVNTGKRRSCCCLWSLCWFYWDGCWAPKLVPSIEADVASTSAPCIPTRTLAQSSLLV